MLFRSNLHENFINIPIEMIYFPFFTPQKQNKRINFKYTFENLKVTMYSRFETYVICGESKSGIICLNGAAARCVCVGDKIIIMAYCSCDSTEVSSHKPKVVFVDDNNRILRISGYEKHGLLKEVIK